MHKSTALTLVDYPDRLGLSCPRVPPWTRLQFGGVELRNKRAEVLFCSIHRYDRGKYYPGGELGNYTSHGTGAGAG